MADKKDIYGDRGLGDIAALMHNQGVSDLSWLSVDEKEYREGEALPKQNLDTIPELVSALSADVDGVPKLIPMRPHVVVNRNPSDVAGVSPVDMTAPIRNRVARMVMANLHPSEIEKRVRLEFSPGDIRHAAPAIREVLAERGVLGNVYIDASHFPNAHRDPKERKYATTFGKDAIFVIGGCGGKNGCSCHETGMCSTFGNKRVVDEVPWGMNVAAHYAPRLASEKRPLPLPSVSGIDDLPVSGREWKERLRAAFLQAPVSQRDGSTRTVHTQHAPAKPQVTAGDVESFVARQSADAPPATPPAAWLKYARRMMHGSDDRALLVAATDPQLRSLAGEYGILGHTYLDMDALGGCRNTLALIEDRGLSPDFVVRRSASCPTCMGASDGACAAISGMCYLTSSRPEIGRPAFAAALERAVSQGRVASEQAGAALMSAGSVASWEKLVSQANLWSPPSDGGPSQYSGIRATAHHGDPGRSDSNVVAGMDPEEVRRTLSHLMNTGLSGRSLQAALLKRYSVEDLKQVPDVGRRASMDDGVQGHFFIDPTAYADYGKGCSDGAKHFRKQGAPHVLASGGCTGCTLQTAPGWCSKYAKSLIRQVPTQVRERVAAARRLPVVQPGPVENPVEKYGLSSELTVDTNGAKGRGIDVSIPGGSLDD